MLVLSRKLGESIIIDGRIHVEVVRLTNGAVRIGVKAPKDVRIDRAEVHLRRAIEAAADQPGQAECIDGSSSQELAEICPAA